MPLTKKTFLLFFLIFICILSVCGCSAAPSESSSSFTESFSTSTSSRLPPKPIESSSSEVSSYSGSAFKDDPTVKYLGIADDIEVYQKAVETGETRLDIVYGKDGVFNTTTEVPATEYWIIDSEGNLLIEQPFYDCMIMSAENWGSLDQRYPTLYGNYKGSFYWYIWNNGKYELTEARQAGEIDSNKNLFGYKKTQYSYDCHYVHILQGLNDKNGKIIFEPVYNYIEIPFKDRFCALTNNRDVLELSEGFCTLFDSDKNTICTYTSINFYFFADGTYIGIAWYSGYGENWGHILYDKNDNPIEVGHRFIDKDGNELSPCFDLFSICGNEQEFIDVYLDKQVTVLNSCGEKITLSLKDYICEP